jgi:2,4-dienoyl-CoA reductase-like NADH-dependent reductase (Old Yellow Enzyme family)
MKFEKLFSPLTLRGVTFKNRIMGVPFVSGFATEDGSVTEENKERYKREAMGGMGSITIEPGVVLPSRSSHNIRFSDDSYIPGVKEIVDIMRGQDPDLTIGMQLSHFLKTSRKGYIQKVEDLTDDDIKNMVQWFADAARRALTVGLDYVEIHNAHTSTLCSFLSILNKRTDAYGVTFDGRMKASTQVFQAVREVVGDKFPIGVRICGAEFIRGGNTLMQSTRIARRFAELGVDYISVSAGDKIEDAPVPPEGYPPDGTAGYSGERMSPSWIYPDGANVYLAEAVRKFVRDAGHETAIVTAGKIRTPQHAEEILQKGQADFIGLARAILADPDWAKKAQEGREKEIVKCAACNWCVEADGRLEQVYCSRWPEGCKVAAPVPWLPKDARPAALPKGTAAD